MTYEAIPEATRHNADAYREWARSQTIGDLVGMAEAGYLDTSTLRTIPGQATPDNPRGAVEVIPLLADQVDRELARRHADRVVMTGVAALTDSGVGAANVVAGTDDVEAAVASLGASLPNGVGEGEQLSAAFLDGDVLFVEGRTSEEIGQALAATRA